ncbi:MAG: PH domain-containing protein [Cyanobacteria bacterium P01_F01_bin.53]
MFFRSAVDPWVYALVVSLPILLIRAVVPQITDANSTIVILTVAILSPFIIIPAWLLMATYYRVDSAMLRIQAGPFSWSVPLEQIRSVTASRSLISSPALSMNRLKIEYGRARSILVSPKNKVAFIEAIGHQPADVLKAMPHLSL